MKKVSIPASGIVVFLRDFEVEEAYDQAQPGEFPSRRAGLWCFYYQPAQHLYWLTSPPCFHPGERDCGVSTYHR